MPLTFSSLQGWEQDNHLEAYHTFQRSARYALQKPYKDGVGARKFAYFKPLFQTAARLDLDTSYAARIFFETHFTPVLLTPEQGLGHVTGFYEPVLQGSITPTARFTTPLYKRPDDLVEITDQNRPYGWNKEIRFAQQKGGRVQPYPDRQQIESGYLKNKACELVYVENSIEAFFIHIQGAARIELPDNSLMGVTYCAKSGHEFTAIGKILIEQGEIAREAISMNSIKSWLYAHPQKAQQLLWRNRSFIFFKQSPIENPHLGPIAAAKVQLTPGRSLAVDRLKHLFGTPFYITAPQVNFGDARPFGRLMIAQDTGSAIIGTARGDLFVGTGVEAGSIAGKINAPADFYLLMPKEFYDENKC